MEPLIVINGDAEPDARTCPDRAASMEPLIVINGDSRSSTRTWLAPCGFNGAVDRDQRRPWVDAVERRAVARASMEPLIVINGDPAFGTYVRARRYGFNGAVDRDQRRLPKERA